MMLGQLHSIYLYSLRCVYIFIYLLLINTILEEYNVIINYLAGLFIYVIDF